MGDNTHLCCTDNRRRVMISLVLLLISTSTQKRFMVQGRAGILNATTTNEPVKIDHREEENKFRNRALIGSSPPRCERRCRTSSCVHCVAIQVPIVPQRRIKQTIGKSSSSMFSGNRVMFSRSDDMSNYKPMRWKCKCGGLIFNP